MLRAVYRRIVPSGVRRSVWLVLSGIRHLFAEPLPKRPFFDISYSTYWQDRGEGLSNPELIQLCTELTPPRSRVLDFGCGSGELLSNLSRIRKVEGLGLDLSEQAVQMTREKGIEAKVFRLSKPDDLSALGTFDLAFATEVLEHTPLSEMILVALSTVAETTVVTIPNTGHLKGRVRLLLGRFPIQWHEHPAEHVRFWTLRDFEIMARHLGFEIRSYRGLPTGPLSRHWPSLFAKNLLFELQKRPGKLQHPSQN